MESTPTGSAAGSPPVPEMGPVGRLINVLFSPTKAFESIARKPGWDWLVPVVLMMICSFAWQTVSVSRIDVEDAVKAQMKTVEKMARGNLDDKKRAEIEDQTRASFEKQKSPARRLILLPFVFIPILIAPALYKAAAAAFGKEGKYKTILAGYAWTQIPGILYFLLSILVLIPQTKADVYDVQFVRVLKSNVAAFLPWETTHKSLLALLSSIDVFDIWAFVLGSIAVSKTTSFSKKGAMGVVGGVWGIYIVFKVILGLLYQSFLG